MAEINVSTWAEFVAACATSGADVVCAENTVWDMNSISPSGAPTVTVACNSISGNGSTIKNASVISQPLFNFTNAATVTRLNIADFTADTAVIAGTVNWATWKMSSFSGVQNSGTMITCAMTFCEDSDIAEPKGCGFTVELNGGSFFKYNSGETLPLRNCKAKFTGGGSLNPNSGDWQNHIQLNYCFIEGDFTQIRLTSYCTMSVIKSPVKMGVYTSVGQWSDCTDEQLHDAAYLTSIGFTCGVVS